MEEDNFFQSVGCELVFRFNSFAFFFLWSKTSFLLLVHIFRDKKVLFLLPFNKKWVKPKTGFEKKYPLRPLKF